jgi:hypothetical protein
MGCLAFASVRRIIESSLQGLVMVFNLSPLRAHNNGSACVRSTRVELYSKLKDRTDSNQYLLPVLR